MKALRKRLRNGLIVLKTLIVFSLFISASPVNARHIEYVRVCKEFPIHWGDDIPRMDCIPVPKQYKDEFNNIPPISVDTKYYKETSVKIVILTNLHGPPVVWKLYYGRFCNLMLMARNNVHWAVEGDIVYLLDGDELHEKLESWVKWLNTGQ